MTIGLLAGALLSAALAFGQAQDRPSSAGPYLWAQQQADHVVMIAMGSRAQTATGWSATSITVFDMADVGPVRVDATVEVDCGQRIRRTTDLYLSPAADPDRPGEPVMVIPGVQWGPPGPSDDPMMDYICTGEHDAGRVRDQVSAHVAKWRAAG
jgi:hypothetical protein